MRICLGLILTPFSMTVEMHYDRFNPALSASAGIFAVLACLAVAIIGECDGFVQLGL